MSRKADIKCCENCWHDLDHPCPDLIECLRNGPICHESEKCKQSRQNSLTNLLRKKIDLPIIFVGTGTCGLGAGAGKTLNKIHSYLSDKNINADVIEVGCIGLVLKNLS